MIYTPATDEDKRALIEWVEEKLPGERFPGPSYPVAVVRDDKIAAVMVYFNYNRSNVEIAFVSVDPRWATRSTISFFCGLPFQQMGCRRMTAVCRKSNKRVHKLLKGIGFVQEGEHLDLFSDEHGITFGMTKRWWEGSKWNERR